MPSSGVTLTREKQNIITMTLFRRFLLIVRVNAGPVSAGRHHQQRLLWVECYIGTIMEWDENKFPSHLCEQVWCCCSVCVLCRSCAYTSCCWWRPAETGPAFTRTISKNRRKRFMLNHYLAVTIIFMTLKHYYLAKFRKGGRGQWIGVGFKNVCCIIFTPTEQWKERKGWGIGSQDNQPPTEVSTVSYCWLNKLKEGMWTILCEECNELIPI